MLVANSALIVIMLMIIKQDAEYQGDEDCYGQCHFLLCWLSRVTGGQELDSSSEHREPWPARHPKLKEEQRGG